MITLICGYPRAGKTTFSERFKKAIHLDTDGLYDGVLRKTKHRTDDVVVEGVYNRQRQRMALLSAYKGEGCRCIWIMTSKEIRQQRTGRRIHDVPFEPPTYSEGWDVIIIIRSNSYA